MRLRPDRFAGEATGPARGRQPSNLR